MHMKTKALAFTISFIVLLIIANLFAISLFAVPYSTDTPDRHDQNCYQTMGYCNLSLTYKCHKIPTAEACRIYVCNECDPAGSVLPVD